MEINKLIERIKEEGLENIGIRVSKDIPSKRIEPAFIITLDKIKLKGRIIEDKRTWENRAELVKAINSKKPRTLPEIYFIGDNFVIKEYIEGESIGDLDGKELEKIAYMMYNFHEASEGLNSKEVESLEDFTKRNFLEAISLGYLKHEEIKRLDRTLDSIPKSKTSIIHGDIGIYNIIKTKEGIYRLIDLEALNVFRLEYEMVRPLNELFSGRKDIIRELYKNKLDDYYSNERFWNTLYLTYKLIIRSQMQKEEAVKKTLEKLRAII
ncbi:MAG: hypothetical protein AABX19_02530 [Nanoarchaeota archaeon]